MGTCFLVAVLPPSPASVSSFSAMFSAQSLLAEIEANEVLIQSRTGSQKLVDGLASQMVHKLQNLQGLTSTDAVLLFDRLETSSLPEDMVTRLKDTLDQVLLQGNSAAKVTSMYQQLDTLQNYLTPSDWEKLSQQSMMEGTHTICSRLRKLGVVSLKESTKRVATGVLLALQLEKHAKMPPYT